jgi:capsular exopolysaccharide synthesis family protein
MLVTNNKLSPALLTHHDPKGPAAEAFRILRTNLQFLSLDKPLKALVVTSATPGEGKSFNAVNLAISYAQAGSRTLLVDADLRRPMVAKLLGRINLIGLTSALVKDAPAISAVQETEIENFFVMTSGPIPPNPAELLGSRKMGAVMDELSQAFDIVIYDTPPLMAVADPSVLATRVDGVLLVVRAGVATRDDVRRAKEALQSVKANVLGVVLDGVKREHAGYGQGYYYYYSSKDKR